jgi:hypothetical protein
VVKPFKKVQLKKNENCLPPTQAISDEKSWKSWFFGVKKSRKKLIFWKRKNYIK